MAKALVTGATGFVGSHLVDLLLERGYRVAVTMRRTSSSEWLDGKPLERIEADLTRPLTLPPCDIVFHVAGAIRADSYEEYLAANRDGAVRVFEASRAKRFVHVSSLAVTGPGKGVDEETPCAPVSLYGRSKWEGEQEIWRRRDRLPVTVIRPPVVYGPRDRGLLELYRTVAKGFRPEIGGSKWLSLVHVRDLVEGTLLAAESEAGAGETFFMAEPEPVTMSGFLDLVELGLGRRALRVRIPDRVVRFLGGVFEEGARLLGKRPMFNRDKALEMTQKAWSCSPAKARRVLGWSARVQASRGVPETVVWYRDRGLV